MTFTRPMKITMVAAAIVGITAGFIIGTREGFEAGKNLDELYRLQTSDTGPISDFAISQCRYADVAHSRDAVLLEIRLLHLFQNLGQPIVDENFEFGRAYIRLAMVEEAAGSTTATRDAIDHARSYFKPVHPGEEFSYQEAKEKVRWLDQLMDDPAPLKRPVAKAPPAR